MVDVKGSGEDGWLAAKDMWDLGCQSRVASLRVKGSERRVFMAGVMARPSGTASEPFYKDEMSLGLELRGQGNVGEDGEEDALVGKSHFGSRRL